MARWKRTVVSVLTSMGMGAALGAWRSHRRRRRAGGLRASGAGYAEPHAPAPLAPPAAPLAPPAEDPVARDPGAAIDEARERLRRQAEERGRAGEPDDAGR